MSARNYEAAVEVANPYDSRTSDLLNVTVVNNEKPSRKCAIEDCILSMSFRVAGINTLILMGVPVYGCGYVHDMMPVRGVGKSRLL